MITISEAELRVKIVTAMAHPVRLMIIEFILGGERSFLEIFSLFHLYKSTISKHLLVLKESGVISSRKTGRKITYKLEVPCVTDFFACTTVVIKKQCAEASETPGQAFFLMVGWLIYQSTI